MVGVTSPGREFETLFRRTSISPEMIHIYAEQYGPDRRDRDVSKLSLSLVNGRTCTVPCFVRLQIRLAHSKTTSRTTSSSTAAFSHPNTAVTPVTASPTLVCCVPYNFRLLYNRIFFEKQNKPLEENETISRLFFS